MLITFFDVRGIVHSEFLPQGQTINQQVYKEILWLGTRFEGVEAIKRAVMKNPSSSE